MMYDLVGKIKGELNMAIIGDVHIGNHLTPSSEVILKLYLAFPDNTETGMLDFIFINGDLFDRLLHRNDQYSKHIDGWVVYMLNLCASRKIALRLLEGTTSHDMKQPKVFIDTAAIHGIDLDIKYIDDIEVEIHPKTGLSILYVPDDWDVDLDNCYVQSVKKIQEAGLRKVHVALMHGAFEYQYPAEYGMKTHNSDRYQALVSHAIFINHVHQYSQFGVIVAPGSFDRYCHGDEKAKGFVKAKINKNGISHVFVENKLAKLFIDIDCRGSDTDKVLKDVDDAVKHLPKQSFVRILANEGDPAASSKEYFRVTYPNLFWGDKVYKKDKAENSDRLVPSKAYEALSLSKDLLPGMLERRLLSKGTDDELVRLAMGILAEHL